MGQAAAPYERDRRRQPGRSPLTRALLGLFQDQGSAVTFFEDALQGVDEEQRRALMSGRW